MADDQQEQEENSPTISSPLVVSNELKSLIAVIQSSHIQIFDVKKGEQVWNYKPNVLASYSAAQFSSNGQYLAVADGKTLVLFECMGSDAGATLEMGRTGSKKKVSCLTFSKDDSEIWFGDKFGDVYSLNIEELKRQSRMESSVPFIESPTLRLGHVSLLTDIKMSTDGNYVITADRDEKIRISCYPMAQEIHYFCLGHTEMLIWVCPLSNNLLLSAAADSTVRLWSIETGKCLSAFNTGSSIPSSYALHSADSVWISYENSSKIDLFKIQNGNNLIKESTIELNSLVFCLTSIKGYLIALVADKPHLLSPSNNLDTLDKINENISLEIKVESGGKSRLKKQRDAIKYKKPRLA